MLRRTAVLGFVALAAGCTQEIVLQDMPDGSNRDAAGVKDARFGDDAWCAQEWARLDYEPRWAQLLIVFDRSAGMQTAFGGTTRQDAAESALMDAINKYQAKVKFGFEQFPADSNDDQSYGECQRNSCCAGSVIKPNWNNGPKISGLLQCGDFGSPCPYPSSETASHTALQKVHDSYPEQRLEEDNDHYVLLVTSSEPYCPASSDACEQALDAADELGKMGIRVVVLSVGYQPTSTSCLAGLSNTGSKLPIPSGLKTPPLYMPSSVSNLNATVAEIALVLAKTTCTMESWDTPPPDDATVKISVGRTIIPRVDGTAQSGWSFANAERTRIVLSGASCELFVNSWESVSAGYLCSKCGGSPACPNSSSR